MRDELYGGVNFTSSRRSRFGETHRDSQNHGFSICRECDLTYMRILAVAWLPCREQSFERADANARMQASNRPARTDSTWKWDYRFSHSTRNKAEPLVAPLSAAFSPDALSHRPVPSSVRAIDPYLYSYLYLVISRPTYVFARERKRRNVGTSVDEIYFPFFSFFF